MKILHLFVLVVVAIVALLAVAAYVRVFGDNHRRRGLLGCRARYVDSGGASFGYVSREDPGGKLVLQNPWKNYETVPIPRERVEFDVKAFGTEAGDDIWAVESLASTQEMFEFYDIVPRTC